MTGLLHQNVSRYDLDLGILNGHAVGMPSKGPLDTVPTDLGENETSTFRTLVAEEQFAWGSIGVAISV